MQCQVEEHNCDRRPISNSIQLIAELYNESDRRDLRDRSVRSLSLDVLKGLIGFFGVIKMTAIAYFLH